MNVVISKRSKKYELNYMGKVLKEIFSYEGGSFIMARCIDKMIISCTFF